MGGLVWFDMIFQACQGPTSFIAYERGWVIFEYSHVFRSGGSLMKNMYRTYFQFGMHCPQGVVRRYRKAGVGHHIKIQDGCHTFFKTMNAR
jgi:hypothetical protein